MGTETTLEELIATLQPSPSDDAASTYPLPTSLDLYKMGIIIYQQSSDESSSVAAVFENYLERIPSNLLQQLLTDLTHACASLIDDGNIKRIGTMSMCGIYSASRTACQLGFSTSLLLHISGAYEKAKVDSSDELFSRLLLMTASNLLVHGALQQVDRGEKNRGEEDEALVDEDTALKDFMTVIQTMLEDQSLTILGDLQRGEPKGASSLEDAILSRFSEETPQREYLLLMVRSSPTYSSSAPAKISASNDSSAQTDLKLAAVKPHDEVRRRIDAVRALLPDLGEGYVETALGCFQGDVERTVQALFEAETNPLSLPATLQVLDKSLPARKKQSETSEDDDETRRFNKKMVENMEKKAEDEAYALGVMRRGARSEYDDDYDDQYDDMDDGGVGDSGLYDVDLDTVKTYNRAVRNAEQEDLFWEAHRSRNRDAGIAKGKEQKKTSDGEKAYRGPNKIKGGRVVDDNGKVIPRNKAGNKKKGGKGGGQSNPQTNQPEQHSQAGGDQQLSKLQKRRRNENKAKIANHHRKERAQRKAAAGGM